MRLTSWSHRWVHGCLSYLTWVQLEELDDEAYLMVTQVSSQMPVLLGMSAAGRAGWWSLPDSHIGGSTDAYHNWHACSPWRAGYEAYTGESADTYHTWHECNPWIVGWWGLSDSHTGESIDAFCIWMAWVQVEELDDEAYLIATQVSPQIPTTPGRSAAGRAWWWGLPDSHTSE